MNACKRFFSLSIKARVVAAALKVLEIDTIDSVPDSSVLPTCLNADSPNIEKKRFIESLAQKVVDKFILKEERMKNLLKMKQAIEDQERETASHLTADGRHKCRFSGCSKTFKYDGKSRRDHEAKHGISTAIPVETVSLTSPQDDMLNYQLALLEIGLLIQNFYDAISEGDGARVIRCWKFALPYLKNDGTSSSKYALEALYMACQMNALLTPRSAHRLMWNRFYKTKNGPGGNIPLDLALEHYNRLVKTVMRNLGPNASNPKALDRYCKGLAVNKLLLDNFDWVNNLKKLSGEHYRRSDRPDLLKIINELIGQQAFTFTPGRQYQHFVGITDSLLTNFDMHDMYRWINEHKKNIYLKRCAR